MTFVRIPNFFEIVVVIEVSRVGAGKRATYAVDPLVDTAGIIANDAWETWYGRKTNEQFTLAPVVAVDDSGVVLGRQFGVEWSIQKCIEIGGKELVVVEVDWR
jgi:hypothetical protein